MLQIIRGMLFDLFMAAIEWAMSTASTIRIEREIRDLEERALNISADLFAAESNQYRWN
jgi:hypothetical protein